MEIENKNNNQKSILNVEDKPQKGVNVPNLRFKEFSDKWKKDNFKNVLKLLTNNTLSRAELNYNSGKIKNIHYGDVLIKFNNFINSSSSEIPYINDSSIPKNYKEMLLKTGDLIIADTAEDYTVGKATELIIDDNSMIISGLHTIPCRPVQNIFISRYLGCYINSHSFHNQLLPLIQGIKVCSISKSQIINSYIAYPNYEEQKKITDFLSLIDQRIETQSKIIEDLNIQIKWISNYIFNTIISEKYPIYSFLKLFKEYKKLNNNKYEQFTVGKYGLRKIEHENIKYSTENHIIFQANSLILGIGIYEIGVSISNIGCCSPIYKIYKIDNTILSSKFAYYFIKYYFYKSKRYITQKSTRREFEFDYKQITKLNFKIPSMAEQEKISKLFDIIYNNLENENKILEKLKEQKKYLLSNMFI